MFDPRIGQARGSGKAHNAVAGDTQDGRAKFFRYRCRACSVESVWPAVELADAHAWAVETGARSIRWSDLDLHWLTESGEDDRPIDWREFAGGV